MIAKLIKLDVQSQLKIANNQAILTPDKAIKELIENSLDANSTQILVSIKNSALDSIIIKDDGSGVSPSNCLLMGLPYSTSKIAKFDDIHSISTYGFRGQALNAIRLLSRKITFSTRTVEDKIGRVYNLNCDKEAVEEAGFKAMSTGTIIQIEGLFEKTPVRRQIYQKQSNVICKNIRELIIKYSLIHFKKRFFLKIDNSPALNLNINSSNSLFDALRTHYTNNCTSKLSYFEFNEPSATFQFQLIIPNEAHKSSVDLWRSKPDRTHVFVNNRPIQESMFKKFLKEMQVLCHSEASTKRYPLMVLNVIVPVKDTDVNIEPDKSRVEIDQIDDIINQLSNTIQLHYRSPVLHAADIVPEDIVSISSSQKSDIQYISTHSKCDNSQSQSTISDALVPQSSSTTTTISKELNSVHDITHLNVQLSNSSDIPEILPPSNPAIDCQLLSQSSAFANRSQTRPKSPIISFSKPTLKSKRDTPKPLKLFHPISTSSDKTTRLESSKEKNNVISSSQQSTSTIKKYQPTLNQLILNKRKKIAVEEKSKAYLLQLTKNHQSTIPVDMSRIRKINEQPNNVSHSFPTTIIGQIQTESTESLWVGSDGHDFFIFDQNRISEHQTTSQLTLSPFDMVSNELQNVIEKNSLKTCLHGKPLWLKLKGKS